VAHPAARAWAALLPDDDRPTEVVPLKEGFKSSVYRLAGVGPGGSVVAKCRARGELDLERFVYQHVLPRLPVTTLACYGFLADDGGGSSWLFLEDGGPGRYSPASDRDRELAAHWLGQLHASAATVAETAGLPDRGPGHYLDHLRAAADALRRAAPFLGPDDRAAADALGPELDRLAAGWGRVERDCGGAPPTLVHGDFVGKNVCVRDRGGETVLLPLDWETAGRGGPAADLARFAVDPTDAWFAAYAAVVRPAWGRLTPAEVRWWAGHGRVFRYLAAARWAAEGLALDWVAKPMRTLRDCLAGLSPAARAVGWGD
jgi:hypothetical protein